MVEFPAAAVKLEEPVNQVAIAERVLTVVVLDTPEIVKVSEIPVLGLHPIWFSNDITSTVIV